MLLSLLGVVKETLSTSDQQSMLTAAAAVASSAALTNVLSHNTALNNLAAALNLTCSNAALQGRIEFTV